MSIQNTAVPLPFVAVPPVVRNFLQHNIDSDTSVCQHHILTFIAAIIVRLHLKCDGTCAETRLRLSTKGTSPFKSAKGITSVDYWQPRCVHQRW